MTSPNGWRPPVSTSGPTAPSTRWATRHCSAACFVPAGPSPCRIWTTRTPSRCLWSRYRAHDGIVGALTLVSIGQARSFDEEHLEIALDIGRRAAQAIEWCRLYERDRRQQMDQHPSHTQRTDPRTCYGLTGLSPKSDKVGTTPSLESGLSPAREHPRRSLKPPGAGFHRPETRPSRDRNHACGSSHENAARHCRRRLMSECTATGGSLTVRLRQRPKSRRHRLGAGKSRAGAADDTRALRSSTAAWSAPRTSSACSCRTSSASASSASSGCWLHLQPRLRWQQRLSSADSTSPACAHMDQQVPGYGVDASQPRPSRRWCSSRSS